MPPTAPSARWSLIGLLLLGLLTGLVFLNAHGTGDADNWLIWQQKTIRHGLVKGYEVQATNYPPLSVAMLWATGRATIALGAGRALGIKVSLLLFTVLTVGVLLAWRRDLSVGVASLWLLLPNAMSLGYIDVYYAPTFVGCLWAVAVGADAAALLLFTLSCLIKWQTLIVGPFFALYFLRGLAWRDPRAWARLFLPTAAVSAVVLFPFGVETLRAFYRAFGDVGSHPNLSNNALNIHWIVTWALSVLFPEEYGALHDGMVWRLRPGDPTAIWWLRLPFAACYGATLLVFARRRRSFENLLRFSVAGYVAYFTLASGVHENHLYVPCLTLLALAACSPSWMPAYLLWTTFGNLNQFFFYGMDGTEPPWNRVVGIDVSVMIAAAEVVLFAMLFLDEVWHRARAEGAPTLEGVDSRGAQD